MLCLTLSGLDAVKSVKLLISDRSFVLYLPIYTTLTIWTFILSCMLLENLSYMHEDILGSIQGSARKMWVEIYKLSLFLLPIGVCATPKVGSSIAFQFFVLVCMIEYCILSLIINFTKLSDIPHRRGTHFCFSYSILHYR